MSESYQECAIEVMEIDSQSSDESVMEVDPHEIHIPVEIPVPTNLSAAAPKPTPELNESWRKAQEALKKFSLPPASTQSSSSSQDTYQPYNFRMTPPSEPVSFPPAFPGVHPPMVPPYFNPYMQTPFMRPNMRPIGDPRQRMMNPMLRNPRPRFGMARYGPRGMTSIGGDVGGAQGPVVYPETVKRYIQRAYLAINDEDRPKLENYIKMRIEPLLQAGTINAVNWDVEPLPHENNFQLTTTWTPMPKQTTMSQPHKSTCTPLIIHSPVASAKTIVRRKKRLSNDDCFIISEAEDSERQRSRSPDEGESEQIVKKKKKIDKSTHLDVVQPIDRKTLRNARFAKDTEAHMSRMRRSKARISTGSVQQRSGEIIAEMSKNSRRSEGDMIMVYDIAGTSIDVEKSYFRLTAAPDPNQVRPLSVLRDALVLVKKKYGNNQNYRYANDQLKSIRQDLMVQNIRNDFTVSVYEVNARIAIKNKDRDEFNQCQNQLKQLYEEVPDCPNRWEFTSYRLLYYIYMENFLDIGTLLRELPKEAKLDECMRFALKIRTAWSLENYLALFELYAKAPKMAGYIMDMFVDRERRRFVTTLLKAFRPNVKLPDLCKWLKMEETLLTAWLAEKGVTVADGAIDCRQYANVSL